MSLEIERKFLVVDPSFKTQAYAKKYTKQVYLSTDPNRTVRIRIQESKGYITIKGASSANGTTRFEWEKELSLAEATQLCLLSEDPPIEKIRFYITSGKHTFEVDEFMGVNKGLVMAEIELSDAEEQFERPHWLGEEVTGDPRYFNASLSKTPFTDWNN